MPISASEIKYYRSAQVSNTPGVNGGRFGPAEIVSDVANNLFADASLSERTAGSTVFRKFFIRNMNSQDLVLSSPRIFVENYTPGADAVYFHSGTQTNLQDALTGSEALYGAGKLDANTSGGATTLTVLIEQSGNQFFANGNKIRVSDRATISGSGNEEFVTINAAPSLSGSVVTLSVTPALANAYLASNTRVAKVYEPGDIKGVSSNVVDNTVGNGAYNNSTQPITVPNIGGVYDDWTITFTSATAYTCAGANEGAVASGGTILSDYSPNNPLTGTPYFTIKSAGFSGVFQSGDTVTFRTTPAAVPLWAKRVIPAGTAAYSANTAYIALDGETS